MQGKRIYWIDELKGVTLIMICLGHISGALYTPALLKYIAYILIILGVPIFFFISGVLFTNKETSTKTYIKKKTVSLLVPYIMLSLLFTILDPYTYNSTYLIETLHYPRFSLPHSIEISPDIQASIEFFLGDICCTIVGVSSRATLPLWFVFVLYFTSIIYFFVQNVFKSKITLTIIASVSFILAMILNFFGVGGYLKIGSILMAFFFYWFGVMVSNSLNYLFEKMNSYKLICLSTLFIFLSVYLAPDYLDQIRFVNGCFTYDKPFGYLVFNISGIIGFTLLIASISKIRVYVLNPFKGILRNIARNSLIILAAHYFFLCVYSLYLKSYIPEEWHFISAVIFIIIGCIIAIVLFRTKLYMFIGGVRSRQSLRECLFIK